MIIYRYEHSVTKNGPYNTFVDRKHNKYGYKFFEAPNAAAIEEFADKLKDLHACNPKGYPDIAEDFPDLNPKSLLYYKSGCLLLMDLFRWFRGHGPKLKELGFNIVTVDVPKELVVLSKSGKQVLYFDSPLMED